MKRTAATALILFCLALPAATRAAEESLEAIENDLSALLKEMDAISSELERIQEITAAPKATAIRVEIHKGANLPAPVAGRILVRGNVEEKREWTTAERDAFAGGAPLVFQVPFLPGTYAARLEVAHPTWKVTPGADFQASLSKGETLLVRLRLSVPPGKTDPVLVPLPEHF